MWPNAVIATIAVTLPLVAAPQHISGIDFKNSLYAWDEPKNGVPSEWHWLAKFPRGSLQLKNGKHRFADGNEPDERAPYLLLRSVTYGDLDGDGSDEAAVDLVYGSGGTANWHYLYVYTFDGQRPKLRAVLESGSRADGGLVRVQIQKQVLILDFQDSELRMGGCCSEGFIRVRYRWKRNRFVESGVRQSGKLQ